MDGTAKGPGGGDLRYMCISLKRYWVSTAAKDGAFDFELTNWRARLDGLLRLWEKFQRRNMDASH